MIFRDRLSGMDNRVDAFLEIYYIFGEIVKSFEIDLRRRLARGSS